MARNTIAIPRNWQRESATLPISLVLKADHFKKDDSATTLDISLCGASVRTKLALAAGDWVGVILHQGFHGAIPCQVVWSREEMPGCWTLAGLEFLETSETLATVGAMGWPALRPDEQLAA